MSNKVGENTDNNGLNKYAFFLATEAQRVCLMELEEDFAEIEVSEIFKIINIKEFFGANKEDVESFYIALNRLQEIKKDLQDFEDLITEIIVYYNSHILDRDDEEEDEDLDYAIKVLIQDIRELFNSNFSKLIKLNTFLGIEDIEKYIEDLDGIELEKLADNLETFERKFIREIEPGKPSVMFYIDSILEKIRRFLFINSNEYKNKLANHLKSEYPTKEILEHFDSENSFYNKRLQDSINDEKLKTFTSNKVGEKNTDNNAKSFSIQAKFN